MDEMESLSTLQASVTQSPMGIDIEGMWKARKRKQGHEA